MQAPGPMLQARPDQRLLHHRHMHKQPSREAGGTALTLPFPAPPGRDTYLYYREILYYGESSSGAGVRKAAGEVQPVHRARVWVPVPAVTDLFMESLSGDNRGLT